MIKPIKYKDLYLFFLMIYFVCLPLGALALGALGSVLRYIAVIPIGFSLFGKKRLDFNAPLILYALFVLICFASPLWSVDAAESLSAAVSQIMLLGLLFSGIMFKYTEEDTEKLKKALAWGSRLSAIIVIAFGSFVEGRFTLDGIISENPNYFCSYFICGIIYDLEKIIAKEKLKKKLLPILELLIYITLVLLTGSRGGLLSTAAGVFGFILFGGKKGQNRIFTKLLVFIGIIAIVLLIIEQLPPELRLRFSIDEVVESGGTGRTDIWGNAIAVFGESGIFRQFFGHGTGTIGKTFTLYGFPGVDSHNAFLGNLVTVGIVGVGIYIMSVLSFIKKALAFKSKFAFAVMVAIFAFTFAASATTLKPYFNIMLYIIICLNLEKPNLNNEVTKQ